MEGSHTDSGNIELLISAVIYWLTQFAIEYEL